MTTETSAPSAAAPSTGSLGEGPGPGPDQGRAGPRVIIIGGGFGGLAVERALKGSGARVALVDRQNHHVFQPLLYQVATASLSPGNISAPIRSAISDPGSTEVVLAEVTGVDVDARRVMFEEGSVGYDYLVIAAGATHDYFGNDQWEPFAPGLKTLSDATEIRRRLLLAFESAEHEADIDAQRAELTFAVVGAGPTGVELCGAIKEIATNTIAREYRNIDPRAVRVILFEGGDRVLGAFPEKLSARAQRDLEALGVEVRLNARVSEVTGEGVKVGDDFVPARNTIWAAGVRASALTKDLGAELDRSGRVVVGPDLSVPGHPEVFVIGDASSYTEPGAERPVPGVAQGALQMGAFVGGLIAREVRGGSSDQRAVFKYKDKGSLAIIGKNRAVAAIGSRRFSGFFAWMIWALVHIMFLVGFRNRVRVMLDWGWKWLIGSHDSRLIIGDRRLRISKPRDEGFDLRRDAPDESAQGGAS